MKFKFDPNQEFQVRAIESTCDLFEGQTRVQAAVRFKTGTLSLAAVANRLDLGDAEIVENLKKVQQRAGIRPDNHLECIEEPIQTDLLAWLR